MGIFDLHCDTLSELTCIEDFEKENAINLSVLKDCTAQCFAIFVNDNEPEKEKYIKEKYEMYFFLKKRYLREFSSVLTVENCGFLNGDTKKAEILKNMDIKIAGLIWNNENCIGYPAVDTKSTYLPLKKFGFELLDILNEYNVIPDLAHLNIGGFSSAIRYYKKPLCVTHSGSYSVYPHPRNLTDEQLKLIGNNGGIVGICFYNLFLNGGVRATSYSDIIAHALHIKKVAGTDAIALGSDYDGFSAPMDFIGFENLENALNSKFTAAETEKICEKNAKRLLSFASSF